VTYQPANTASLEYGASKTEVERVTNVRGHISSRFRLQLNKSKCRGTEIGHLLKRSNVDPVHTVHN
jgi:hypothetical protein